MIENWAVMFPTANTNAMYAVFLTSVLSLWNYSPSTRNNQSYPSLIHSSLYVTHLFASRCFPLGSQLLSSRQSTYTAIQVSIKCIYHLQVTVWSGDCHCARGQRILRVYSRWANQRPGPVSQWASLISVEQYGFVKSYDPRTSSGDHHHLMFIR